MAKKKPNLRRLHAQGKRFLRESTRRERRGKGTSGTVAAFKGKTQSEKNRLIEARLFARLYNDDELNWLCQLGKREGRPLTRVDVLQLIRIKDRRRRNKLAEQCSKKEWTVRRLEAEVKLIEKRRKLVEKRRRSGGRRQTPPQTVAKALLVTQHMAASWVRWKKVLEPVKGASKRVSLNQLPKPVRKKVLDMYKLADQLCDDIEQELHT